MASQLFDEREIKSLEPLIQRGTPSGRAWDPFEDENDDPFCVVDCNATAKVAEENCPRALLVGICVEAVILLSLYGGWRALQFAL